MKFLKAIKEVAEGGSAITPPIATKVLKMFQNQNLKAYVGRNIDLGTR